jgi:arylsulfatase A-like enzyme
VIGWLGLLACGRPDPGGALGALACPGCDLVVISITNTRRDHLGIYGYPEPTSPNIDAFFADALVFQGAYAAASWTLPDAASLFTGVVPYRHGLMDRIPTRSLAPSLSTLAERLHAAGYRTGAFTGSGDYQRIYGVDHGFDVYVDRFNYGDLGIDPGRFGRSRQWEYGPISAVLPVAERWLAAADGPTFLFLQGYDTHCPFEPDDAHLARFPAAARSAIDFSDCLWTFDRVEPRDRGGERVWPLLTSAKNGPGGNGTPIEVLLSDDDLAAMVARYDAEIAQVDDTLAHFFATLEQRGRLDRTIVVLLAEHGDLFGEHGRFMRGGPLRGTFYDPVLHFPLLVRHPAVRARTDVPDLVETVDLMPTLLGWLHVADPQADVRDGRSLGLSPFGDAPVRDAAFSGSRFTPRAGNPFFDQPSDVQAVRAADGWKLVRERFAEQTNLELFRDGTEAQDLHLAEPARVDALGARLDAWEQELAARPAFPPVDPPDRFPMGTLP